MKIAVIGASGRAGSQLVAEALRRDNAVLALARNADSIPEAPGVERKSVNADDAQALAAALKGCDVALSATRFASSSPGAIIEAVKTAGVARLLVVGGAASLEVARETRLIDTPHFPEAFKAEAMAGIAFLEALRLEPTLDWTYVSPSASFFEGGRTGNFRVGGDLLLVAADGKSSISFADFAIAMLDEVENPRHRRARFTVGY